MHEMSIVTAVLEQVEEVARQHRAVRVRTVRLCVGELAGVVPEALRFSFEVAREGTASNAAELVVDTVAACAHCAPCGADFEVGTPPKLWCPHCDRPATRLLSGRELQITDVELEEAT
jgi:hydrogenase nickel incorporation protein HypA/HybF